MAEQADATNTAALENSQKLNNAIQAISEKKPPPEIDFTLHTMDDGSQVSTQERVCKGTGSFCFVGGVGYRGFGTQGGAVGNPICNRASHLGFWSVTDIRSRACI
jgi:hypothetical protein